MSYDTEGQYAVNAGIMRQEKAGRKAPDEITELWANMHGLITTVKALSQAVQALQQRKSSFDGKSFGREMVDIVKGYVKKETARAAGRLDSQVEDRIGNVHRTLDDLRARLDRIEQRPQLTYLGTWKQGSYYAEGQLVTYGGSLWHCNSPTGTQPSTSDQCWTMAARKGRDGKEALP